VLAYSYQVPKSLLLETLRNLLHARQLTINAKDAVARAVDAYANGRGDFADYVIRERANEAGCDTVLTFDLALLKEEGFTEPQVD
jgi:predicted nucleic-acid-binding protein